MLSYTEITGATTPSNYERCIIMKRDLDLIRYILIGIEDSVSTKLTIDDFVNDDYDAHTISFHISLLLDYGYIEANKFNVIGQNYQQYLIKRITSSGYDYLDSIRDSNVWSKTKESLKVVGGSASLEVIKAIAGKVALGFLGL